MIPTLPAQAQARAQAADARDRGFLRVGVTEADVLLKIGKPDHEAFVSNLTGQPEEPKDIRVFIVARKPA